jgi:hypothetical protein
MKYILVLLILLIPVLANAEYKFAEDWTWQDTARQAGVVSLLVVDMGQTLYIAGHPDEWRDINPILGEHPDEGKVWGYFISCAVVHTLVSLALPPKSRAIWQYSTIAVEGLVVGRNYGIGIGMEY